MRNHKSLWLACGVLTLLLAACGEQNHPAESAAQPETTAPVTTAAETTTTVTSTTAPPPAMEQLSAMIEETPPEEMIEAREGVEYPVFEKYYYQSQTAGRETGVNVLLPCHYTPEKQYPVLYVLHGSEDNEDWMADENVHISTLLTNLILDGKAKEMIVVSPYIYCDRDTPYTVLNAEAFLSFDNFLNDLETDLKPFIEANFPVAEGRENAAVTGFSIGGRESMNIGFSHPEQFGWIGAICPASGVVSGTGEPYLFTPEQFCFPEYSPYLLLISASAQDWAVGEIPYIYDRMLTENGTPHLFHEMQDYGHEVRAVTAHLYNFMRMIFQ